MLRCTHRLGFIIYKFIYISASLLIFFNISACYSFSWLDNHIRAIVHYLLLHICKWYQVDSNEAKYYWLHNLLRWTQTQRLTIHKFVYNHSSLLIFFISGWSSMSNCSLSVTVCNRQLELRQYMTDCKTCCIERRNRD